MSGGYFPGRQVSDWETAVPEEVGLDGALLKQATGHAIRHESSMNRDIAQALQDGHFEEPAPMNEIVGPARPRGDPNGMILKGGRIVAKWGDTTQVDMTFSAAKSYLAVLAGIAHDDGLIPDLDAPIRELVDDGGFDAEQNRNITWSQLLQQTSEWEGELWGKPDLIDRNRVLDRKPGEKSLKGTHRDLQAPGGHWEYNDVRVNRMALSLLRVFRQPLPDVLRERVMGPIGGSDIWEWHGYRNSWVEIDGKQMQSVSGGAHWGGGIFIHSRDHARIGLLMANRGRWADQQILSEAYVRAALTPCALNPSYGYMWWLNSDGTYAPSAPKSSFFAMGVGTNLIWVAPEQDLVAVVRWIEKSQIDGFCRHVMEAVG